jgi:pimeloyl-ACP methyl ester carboxylesterase
MTANSIKHWQEGGGFLEFHGHRLFARSGGEGDALLLIHGFPTSSYDWTRLWPTLAGEYELHAIDMLGFGLSDKPADYPYSIPASADQWQALALARGLTQVTVLAHDYGNTVAQELLARQREGNLPFRIRATVFLNGGLFPEATFPLLLQKLLLSPLGPLVARLSNFASFARSLRRICAQPSDQSELREHWQLLVRANGRRVLPKLIRYIRERRQHRQRWVDALQHAGIPLCLIDGVEDPISGASIVQRWRELLPDSPVVELAGVGHYPQLEAPERVLAALRKFMADTATR